MTVYKSPFPDVALRDQTITERVFEDLVTRTDAVVLIDGPSGAKMTGATFMDRVKRLAGGLTAAGFGAGKVVALMAPNSPEYCVVFHAVAWAGGTITTLNPSYTASEVAHQLDDSGAALMITVPEMHDTAKAGAGDRAVVAMETDDYDALFGTAQVAQVPVDLDAHTVVLPYSSGTTGLPKGVMLSHRNLVVNVDQTIVAADFRPGEVTAGFLPFFHIFGMTALMNLHLGAGGTVVTLPRFDLDLFLRISQDHKTRRMWLVPPVALALAKHPVVDNYDLSSLEVLFCGAAPLGPDLAKSVEARLGCIAAQGYGMTELSPVAHAIPVNAPKPGSGGMVVSNSECMIVDPETGASVAPGTEGEVWVRGPQVMQGYLNNPIATAETLTDDGWLKTGDIGYVDEEGYIFISDRLKELIKYKGFQIAPAELEAALISMEGLNDAAVIGRPDEEAGEVPVAFIVVGDGGPDEAAIHANFKANLASYKQLKEIHFVEEIPKSASGKILRRLLREQKNAQAD